MTKPGIFVLSLDMELAWGMFDIGLEESYRPYYERTRPEIRKLLGRMDQFEIPSTWAFVGHLLLDRCESVDGRAHPDVLTPRPSWHPRDWHDADPCTDLERDPFWYGRDILDQVRSARVEHEIATHTFSHVVADDPSCTREILRSQLSACQKLHASLGLDLKSVVFPRNGVAHLDVLGELGIVAYRGEPSYWYRGLTGVARQVAHAADRALALPAPTHRIDRLEKEGLVDVRASMLLLSREGFRRLIPMASRRRQALQGVRRAAERGEMFHLWLHPSDLGTDDGLGALLGDVFCVVDSLRRKGRMEVLTMRQAARRALETKCAEETGLEQRMIEQVGVA